MNGPEVGGENAAPTATARRLRRSRYVGRHRDGIPTRPTRWVQIMPSFRDSRTAPVIGEIPVERFERIVGVPWVEGQGFFISQAQSAAIKAERYYRTVTP